MSAQRKGKPYFIELSNNSLTKSIDLEYEITSVLDSRSDTSFIGQVQTGAFNKKRPAKFKESVSTSIMGFLKSYTRSEPGSESFFLRVITLWVAEKTTFSSENGFRDLELELIKQDENGQYSKYCSCIRSEKKGGLDVTKGHGKRLGKLLAECLLEFNESMDSAMPVPLENLDSPSMDKIFNRDSLEIGFYVNEVDLFKNAVTDEGRVTVKEKGKEHKRYIIKKKKDRKRIKHKYYYDGSDLFINSFAMGITGSNYSKFRTKGRYAFVSRVLSDPGATIAFGAIGAAASNKERGFVLDTVTGLFFELDEPGLKRIIKDHPELTSPDDYKIKDAAKIYMFIKDLNSKISGSR